MKFDPVGHTPCRTCEDAGPVPGQVFCEACQGMKMVSVRCPGYAAQLVRCDECLGLGGYVCNDCEGTGESE